MYGTSLPAHALSWHGNGRDKGRGKSSLLQEINRGGDGGHYHKEAHDKECRHKESHHNEAHDKECRHKEAHHNEAHDNESRHKESFRIIHNLLRNMENMPEVSTRRHSAPLRTEGKCESGTMFALDALSFDWD